MNNNIYTDYNSAAQSFIDGFSNKLKSMQNSDLKFMKDLRIFTEEVPNSNQLFTVYGFGTIDYADYGFEIVCQKLNPQMVLRTISSKLLDANYYTNINIVETICKKSLPNINHATYLTCGYC